MNPDTKTSTELMAFWKAARANPRKTAGKLFPKKPKGYIKATETLAAYAVAKATAIDCRLQGKVQAAQTYERHCELYYEDLPSYARW